MKNLILLCILCLMCACGDKQAPAKELVKVKKINLEETYGKLYQYYHQSPTTQAQKDENIIIEYASEKGLDVQRTQSGLYYTIVDKGVGAQVQRGDRLTAEYKGYFTDGKEFDSSYKRNRPMQFNQGQMVAGWNEGLLLMNKGGKAKFLIPSHLGYGARGFPGAVPPNRVIIFDLELLNQ